MIYNGCIIKSKAFNTNFIKVYKFINAKGFAKIKENWLRIYYFPY